MKTFRRRIRWVRNKALAGLMANQSRTDRHGGSERFAAARGAGHGLDRESASLQQEQSAYNGHVESTCDQPLPLFNRQGDCLAVKRARYYWSLLAKMETSG